MMENFYDFLAKYEGVDLSTVNKDQLIGDLLKSPTGCWHLAEAMMGTFPHTPLPMPDYSEVHEDEEIGEDHATLH